MHIGFCDTTEFGNVGQCSEEDKGAFKPPWRWSSLSSQDELAARCRQLCLACERCRFVSFSLKWRDCSWYHECDTERLRTDVAGFRTLAVRNASRTDDDGTGQRFCAPPDHQPYLAVLGVITTQWSPFRHMLRKTWLPSASSELLTRLVMRGQNASREVIDEAARLNDIVFLPSPASLSKTVGPIQSTWMWFKCATSAWPSATFIGKTEDDIWVHLPSVVHSLRASRRLPDANGREIYWGLGVEAYHWSTTKQRPTGFGSWDSVSAAHMAVALAQACL